MKMFCHRIVNEVMCIIDRIDIWSQIYEQLPRSSWANVSLVCRNAGNGLRSMMMLRYGGRNSWAAECPEFVHVWQCLFRPHGPMIAPSVPYPNAFSDPASTQLQIISDQPSNLKTNLVTTWEDFHLVVKAEDRMPNAAAFEIPLQFDYDSDGETPIFPGDLYWHPQYPDDSDD